jgi:hypothetical protein
MSKLRCDISISADGFVAAVEARGVMHVEYRGTT